MIARDSLDRRPHARLGMLAIIALTVTCMGQPASATGSRAERFSLVGSAMIRSASLMQSGGSFRIDARLSGAVSTKPSSARGYSMTAHLAQVPLVCSSEIIFNNGFD